MSYFLSEACTYTEKYNNNGKHTYTFTGPCIETGKMCSVTVDGKDLYQYHQGKFIQDAFPYLSEADREFMISGLSKDGWEKVYNDD